MPDLARLHRHKLVVEQADCPYYCSACNQLGFGKSYVCKSGCNFFIHEQCGNPKATIDYPFSKKCVLKFREDGQDKPCDACGKTIKDFHYKCTCNIKKRYLHPACLGHEKTLQAANGLTLQLEKVATAKCLHCGTKDLWYKVRGWAYVSSCGSYCYHLSCVREIINKNWRYGFFTGKSDPFQTVKERFPEDMDKMHNQIVATKGRKTRKQAKVLLEIIFNVVTGNPFGLIGAAQTYFSSSS